MKYIFAEMGFGNDTFFSTEFEDGETEYRVPRFVTPKRITECYVRIWIAKTVFIVSTKKLFEIKKKDKTRYKLLLGIGGVDIK
jgi:hypothetical protein